MKRKIKKASFIGGEKREDPVALHTQKGSTTTSMGIESKIG